MTLWDDSAELAARGLRRERTRSGLSYATAGDGSPMLFCHGGSGAWTHWLETLAPLSARFRVAALDLPGFGLSPAPPKEIANADYVALVAEAATEIAQGAPVHLCGFSFGSYVAAAVAEQLGARAARLSLIGPAGFPPPVDRPVQLYGPRSLAKRLGRAPTDAELREMHRHNLSGLMLSRPAAIDDPRVDMHIWNVAHARFDSRRLSWSGDMHALYGRLTLPVMVIYGALDRTHAPTLKVRVDELLEIRPDTRLLALEDIGHWAMAEAAETVNAALASFHGEAEC